MEMINRIILWVVIVNFMVLGWAGCREAHPKLRIEKNTRDSLRPANEPDPQVIKNLGNNTKIVSGVPATAPDRNESAAEDPTKDKPGAIALKKEY